MSQVVCLCAGHAVQGPALASLGALARLLLHALRLADGVQHALNSSATPKASTGISPTRGAAGAAAWVSEGSAWRGRPHRASVLRLGEALALARAAALVDSRRARAALLRLVVLAAPLPQARRIASETYLVSVATHSGACGRCAVSFSSPSGFLYSDVSLDTA